MGDDIGLYSGKSRTLRSLSLEGGEDEVMIDEDEIQVVIHELVEG